MRVRSTGLGQMEMVAGFTRLEPVENGFIVMEMHSSAPMVFKIRAALTGEDLRHLIGIMLKNPSLTLKIIASLFVKKNNKPVPKF
jgi:hypothetical protein